MTVDTLAIGVMTMVLTQLLKKMLPGEDLGPQVVVGVSFVAMLAWVVSQPTLPGRTDFFLLMNVWAEIALTAIGTYSVAKMQTAGDGVLGLLPGKSKSRPQAKPIDPPPSWLPGER